jgi:hypothetical protein
MKANPSKKQTSASSLKKWQEYLDLTMRAFHKSIILANSEQIDLGQLPIEWEKLRIKLTKNRNFHYLDWFHTNFPLFKIVRTGYPGTLTMIEPLYELTLAATAQTSAEAFQYLYDKEQREIIGAWADSNCTNELVDWVPINVRSLEAYIKSNLAAAETSTKAHYIDTLTRNLVYARSILLIAKQFESIGMEPGIPQIVSESEFGRRYYKSLNLQNCPKTVRHAALGHCFQYDLNASVFAWKLNKMKELDPSVKLPYTMEYLDEKNARRNMLADVLDIPLSKAYKVELIKKVITAIGFGAKESLGNIIKSPEARKQLLDNPWLAGFRKEQALITRTIVNCAKPFISHLECLKEDDKIKHNKIISYLYQHEERMYIDALVKDAKSKGTLLLVVHDGFYTKVPQKMMLLRENLIQLNQEAGISCEEHHAWGFNEFEKEHKNLIRKLEIEANDGFIPHHIESNYKHLENILQANKHYSGNDEFDNGNRLEVDYDPDLDPFYD